MECEPRVTYLTGPELAEFLRVSQRTIENWRRRGQGPPFLRVGAQVRYERQEVEAWIRSNRVVPNGEG